MVTFLWNKYFIMFSVGLLVLFYVDYRARESVRGEIENQELRDSIETRKKVEDAIQDTPTTADLVLEWLSQRGSE